MFRRRWLPRIRLAHVLIANLARSTRLDKLHIDAVVDINIRPEMYDVVRGSMVAIRLLFRTCQKIATRHSAELFEMSDVESDDGEALEQTNTPNFWAGFVNKLGHSLHRSWLGWRWTVTDRRQFDDLLIQLIMLIGDLEKWQPELVVMGSAVAVA